MISASLELALLPYMRLFSHKYRCILTCYRRFVTKYRNVGVVAHIDAGKTTTSEQMLYLSGETKSIGRVDDGDTVMDFLPQERERGITISSAAVTFQWNDHTINLIDTPGHVDFTIEVERSARVLDGAILVLDAVAGVQAQTQTVWKQVKNQQVSTIAFVNKMDRDGSSYERAISSIKTKLLSNPVAIQYPLGSEQSFHGVVDLLSMERIMWGGPNDVISSRAPVKPLITSLSPGDPLYAPALEARLKLIESLAEIDDLMLDKYLTFSEDQSYQYCDQLKTFPADYVVRAIRRCCLNGSMIPTLCGSSLRGKGVELLLDAVTSFLPSPADRSSTTLVHLKNNTKKIINYQTKELCALAFKVVHDPTRGYLVYVRVYSGTVTNKQVIYNATRQCKERINQLVKVSADDYIATAEASAGDVVCLIGLKSTVTGDTLVADKSIFASYCLEGLVIPESVYAVTIEPERSAQQSDLENALKILQVEDPSLRVEHSAESDQIILRGLGELHIEIVVDKLNREYGIPVYIGKSYVAYRESIFGDTPTIEDAYTYERIIAGKRLFARIQFRVEAMQSIISNSIVDGDPKGTRTSEVKSAASALQLPIIEIDSDVAKQLNGEEYTGLEDSLKNALLRGPRGYPVMGLKVTVQRVEKDFDTTAGAIRACTASFLDRLLRNPQYAEFLEPIMSVEISAPTTTIGTILSDLTVKKRADIIEVNTDDSGTLRTTIIANIPLATMLGYATSIRSMTQGEGQFSMEYLKHAPIDYDLALSDINKQY